MTTNDFKELDKLIDHLRSKGVLVYKAEGLELTLLPEEPIKVPKETKKSVEEVLEGKRRVGADGLTAEEQADLYNSVIDAPKD